MRAAVLLCLAYLAVSYGGPVTAQSVPTETKEPPINPTVPPTPSPATWFLSLKTSVNVSEPTIVFNITRSFSPNAPNSADRLWALAQIDYYMQNGFFRVVPDFVVQFGISGDPAVAKRWQNANIPDDPVVLSNQLGTFAFASAGPDTRTTQLFINYGNNSRLDSMGFSPCGYIISGLAAAQHVYAGYGQNPSQQEIYAKGNFYLHAHFPKLSYITESSYSLTPPTTKLDPERPLVRYG